MGTAAPPRKKLPHLQGIRGLAIIAVTLFHFFSKYFSNGYLGVDIFFALSGYLMTMMLSQLPKIGLVEILDFLYRRIKRIVPLYYFCTLATLMGLNYAAPLTIKVNNIDPAMNALVFATNLIRPNNMQGYFEKLGAAVDLFTHTWSLAVEMQFYLFFPAIFIIYRALPHKYLSYGYLGLNSLFSFFYYTCCDEFTSFNSVFSRIWQFNAGMLIYTIINPSPFSDTSSDPLESAKRVEYEPEISRSLNSQTLYSLAVLLAIITSPQKIYSHFGRVLAIIITMQLFQHGGGCILLENRVLVHIGEVSYSWYLVHWPFAAICKHLEITDHYKLLAVYFFTLFLSELLHFAYERVYLKWEKITIGALVAALLLTNGMAIYTIKLSIPPGELMGFVGLPKDVSLQAKLTTSFNWPSDFMTGWKGGYEGLSKEKLININENNGALDLERSLLWKYCKEFIKTNNSMENWCIFEEGLNVTAPLRLLVVGNSYASNLFPVIHDECKNNFSHMEVTFCGECEVLARTNEGNGAYYDCTQDGMFMDAVKRVQPDVLFIIQRIYSIQKDRNEAFRMFKMLEIVEGTNPFDDFVFKTASERLTEIQKYVKKRIFILDDFPEAGNAHSSAVNYLKRNQTIPELGGQSFRNTIARIRIQRLASECPKCKVFDYTPQFFFNGKFMFYDPKHYVAFTTYARHLTPAGHERVRPLVKHLCNTL